MLIEPTDVASYSVYDRVKNRPEELLAQDIIEAEAEAALITGHRFEDSLYDPLPGKVKLALVKLAQYFALINSDESASSSYQSEKMGDYSYTVSGEGGIQRPEVYHLLEEFIKPGYVPESSRLKVRSL
ncbi:protein YqbG [Bacillus subtilis]